MTQAIGRKILIIDDEEPIRELLRILLERSGYEVLTAGDGISGLELAEAANPDLVVVDGLLPKMHGFVVCRELKKLRCPPKVVFFTGIYTKPTYKWEATHDFGADDFVPKAVRPTELISSIERLLAIEPSAQRRVFLPLAGADATTGHSRPAWETGLLNSAPQDSLVLDVNFPSQ